LAFFHFSGFGLLNFFGSGNPDVTYLGYYRIGDIGKGSDDTGGKLVEDLKGKKCCVNSHLQFVLGKEADYNDIPYNVPSSAKTIDIESYQAGLTKRDYEEKGPIEVKMMLE